MPLISAITSLFSERKIKKNLGNKHSKDLFLWIRENVTDSHIAEQMYLDLIKENPFNLAYLEKNEITQKLCSNALAIDLSVKDLIPSEFFTLNMHHSLYKNDPSYFRQLPDSMKTADLCLLAVKDNSDNLNYVPSNMKTSTIIKAAFENFKNQK